MAIFFTVLQVGAQSVEGGGQRTVTLKGTVVDADENFPLEFATLVLESTDNPSVVTGGITDADGKFEVDAPAGNYNVKVEYISYKSFELKSQDLSNDRNFGTIKLSLDVAQLDAVEVTGEKTTVEVRLDKKIYNIGKDLTTSGATVTDALANVPSVSVDVEGAVSLRGNENVRILINGKPSALAGFGSTDALMQLPADAIEKVEVITSPSARYDAEGTAGILNIVLKKDKALGFNGSVNTTIGNPDRAQVSTNLNFRTKKFNIFTTLGYTYREGPGSGYFDNNYNIGDYTRIIEDRDINRRNNNFNGNIGIEYFLTDKSSITGSFFTRLGDGKDQTDNLNSRYNGTDLVIQSLRREIQDETQHNYQFALNYVNNLDEDGQKLTADIQYSRDNQDEYSEITENSIFPESAIVPTDHIYSKEKQREWLFQVDYVLPMGEAQFEAGYRGNYQSEPTDYQLDTLNYDTGEFDTDRGVTNIFKYTQNVNAFYTQYGNKFGKFSALLGLRLETTNIKGELDSQFEPSEDDETLIEEFDNDYIGLFPTVNVTYELNERENISLGYNRRINRPRSWFLNPFPSRDSRTNIRQGNPALAPAYADAFDLGYLKRWEKLTLTSSVYYQRETNSFEWIQQESPKPTDDGLIIFESMPINLATNQRYGAEVGLMYNPFKWWRLNGSFNFFKFIKDGEYEGRDFGAENTSWFSRFSSKLTLPAKIEWQVNSFYMGPQENSQTKTEGMFSVDMAFAKDILKDNATITLNVSDLFNSRKRQSFTQNPNSSSDSEFQWRVRQVNLSFVYRFNQSKRDRNRNGRPNNDDFEEEGGFGKG
ncbi:outer membrane beta-barrel family protein [Robertkochia solimangrovi]|uniref:outer membrane beta-barrel family protein n=1 Tax=Robertkochia solimangrovi TaxID=2213046 RepID=UPI001F5591FB|nr:outer membrane beta-barrel family protein [Robertkochia solimangrovi]